MRYFPLQPGIIRGMSDDKSHHEPEGAIMLENSRMHARLNGFAYAVASGAAIALALASPAAAKAAYIKFDVPGAVATCSSSINSTNVVAGTWNVYGCIYPGHGFIRASDGTITTFDPANSTDTADVHVNDGGAIAGDYWDNTRWHGFTRAPNGTVTTFDVKGSEGTFGFSINKKGYVAGVYTDRSLEGHGYVRAPGGEIKTFDVPGANYGTFPNGINSMNVVAGMWFSCQYYCAHGFVRASDGTITTFDPPGSTYTVAAAINAKNAIAGDFSDNNGDVHGFIRAVDGTFTVFDFPAGTQAASVLSLNAKNAITGWYADDNNVYQGFEGLPNGALKTIDLKNASNTQAAAINDGGVIAGSYSDANGEHGFLRMP